MTRWRQASLKRMARVTYGLGQPPPSAPDGVPIIRATNIHRGQLVAKDLVHAAIEDIPLQRAPLLRAGEILVVRSGAYTGDSALITKDWEGAAPGYDLRLTPQADTEPRYLAYQILSSHVQNQIDLVRSRAAQPHLNAEELSDLQVHVPPRPFQLAIADFLDRETARIDQLILRRRSLAKVLSQRWLSEMHRAVTKGLRSGVELVDSELGWAGHVPAHWGIPPVYANYEVQLGKMLNPERAAGPYPAPYLRNVNIQWDRIDIRELPTMTFDEADRVKYALQPADLLVCEGGEAGRAAMWSGEMGECFYQKALHRVRSRTAAHVRFLMYSLWAAASLNVFAVEGNQATIGHLTAEKLRVLRFPLPPTEEQDAIVGYLDRRRRLYRQIHDSISAQVARLKEHRTAWITAAVTGQLDVASAAA